MTKCRCSYAEAVKCMEYSDNEDYQIAGRCTCLCHEPPLLRLTEIAEANRHLSHREVRSLHESEVRFEVANGWAQFGIDEGYVPYVARYRRVALFLQLGLSLSEGFLELREVLEQAKKIFQAKKEEKP